MIPPVRQTGGTPDRPPGRAMAEAPMRLIVVDVMKPAEPPPPTDLGRAIRRMYPTLARMAVAICRLHGSRGRQDPGRTAARRQDP